MRWWKVKWRVQHHARRIQLAARYLTGRLTKNDAQDLFLQMQDVAGWYSVATLCEEDALESAVNNYVDTPDLRDTISAACYYVNAKFDYSETTANARQDALDLLEEQAESLGLTLEKLPVETFALGEQSDV